MGRPVHGPQLAQACVVGSKVMAPLRHTVSFVNDKTIELASTVQVLERIVDLPWVGDPLWRAVPIHG